MELINKQTGNKEDVSYDNFGNGFMSGQYAIPKSESVYLVNPAGVLNKYDPEDVHDAVTKGGYKFPTSQDVSEHETQQKYGGRPLESMGLAALDSASLGMGSRALVGSGLMDQETAKQLPEQNPESSAIGSVLGIAGGMLLSPEAKLLGELRGNLAKAVETGSPALIANAEKAYRAGKNTLTGLDALNPISAVSKIGNSAFDAIAAVPVEAGLVQKAAAKLAGGFAQGALEGTAWKLGELNRRDAIGEDITDGDHLLSEIGYNALLSGAMGGIFRGAIESLPAAASKGKDFISSIDSEMTKDLFKKASGAMNFGSLAAGALGNTAMAKAGAAFKAAETIAGFIGKAEEMQAVTAELKGFIDKSKKMLISKAKDAVEPTTDILRKMPAAAATAFTNANDREERQKDYQKKEKDYDKVTTELNRMASDPDLLIKTLSASTDGIYQVSPKVAQQMQQTVLKRALFLQSKIPQNQVDGLFPDKYKPSALDISKFNSYLSAADKPLSVLDSLKSNTISKEQIETLNAIYPDLYNAMRFEVMNNVMSSKTRPNYQKKLSLSLFFGKDVDSSLKPEMIAKNQESFSKMKNGESHQASAQGINPTAKGLQNLNFSSRSMLPIDKALNREESR